MPIKQHHSPKSGSRLASIIAGNGDRSSKQAHLPTLVPAEELQTIITNVLAEGGAIMFAQTSDGGAICITLFFDKERTKLYAATREQWLGLLGDLAD